MLRLFPTGFSQAGFRIPAFCLELRPKFSHKCPRKHTLWNRISAGNLIKAVNADNCETRLTSIDVAPQQGLCL